MPLYDFSCHRCEKTFEARAQYEERTKRCEECGTEAERMIPATHSFSTIQVTHKKSLKLKAGYVHSHGDKPKTPGKIQVGYGSTNFSSTE